MGMFDFGAGAGAVVGDVVGAVLGHNEAIRSRNWQENMSGTAHQREVADLRRAGLNPILSATGGSGSSTPGGAEAPPADIGGVSEALQASAIKSQIGLQVAQANQANAAADLSAAERKILGPKSFLLDKIEEGLRSGPKFIEDFTNWFNKGRSETQKKIAPKPIQNRGPSGN